MNETRIYQTLSVVLACLLVLTNIYWYVSQPEPVTMKLNFAYQYGFHYGPSIIMDHFNLVEKHSGNRITVSYFTISGGTAVNEAILAGQIDFAQVGTPPAIIGVDKELGIKILGSMGAKEHEMWTWRDDITSIKDIKVGDIVNVVKIYSIEHVGFIKAFLDLGRTREEVDQICSFFKKPDAYQVLTERQIDVDFTGVPYVTFYAENSSIYHKIADDTSIWGLPLAGGTFIGKTTFDSWVIDAVLDAWIESIDWIENNPKEASKIIGAVYEYDESEAWELWQESKIVWGPTIGLDVLETQAEIMYNLEIISQKLTLEDMMFEQTLNLME